MDLKKILQFLSDMIGVWGGFLFVHIGWLAMPTEARLLWATSMSLISVNFEKNVWWRSIQAFFFFEALVSAIGILYTNDTSKFILNACAISGVILIFVNGFQALKKLADWADKAKTWLDERQP